MLSQMTTPTRTKNRMGFSSRLYYFFRRFGKWIGIFLSVAGPGIIVMVADNDAGGITTYTARGAQYGNHLLWFLVILGPVAYFVQEMTVRLGAVTKRGHAEAIFSSFGRFWGWFSLLDLVPTDCAPEGVVFKEFAEESSRVLIKEMILDKKIIDTDEYEVEVVYDIHLLRTERGMFVVHVDVTKAGMLRRLHLGWLTHFRSKSSKAADLLPWKYVQPLPSDIDRFHGNVKLNISREKITDIHPVDLADIMEELSTEERVAIMDTLDMETAADTLEEAEPRVQRDLVASLRHDRIAELLQTMTPAQIADLLEILPRIDAEALKKTLPGETALKVNNLLQMHEVSLSTIATNRFLALSESATVKTALSKFRSKKIRYDVIMYVYVTAENGTLKGVVDIRELIQNRSDAHIGNIMTEQVVTLSPEDTLSDAATEFTKYGFRALPMVDKDRNLLGVVSYKDLLAMTQ